MVISWLRVRTFFSHSRNCIFGSYLCWKLIFLTYPIYESFTCFMLHQNWILKKITFAQWINFSQACNSIRLKQLWIFVHAHLQWCDRWFSGNESTKWQQNSNKTINRAKAVDRLNHSHKYWIAKLDFSSRTKWSW